MTSDKDEPSSSNQPPLRSATRILRDGALWVTFFATLAVPLSYLRSMLLADIDDTGEVVGTFASIIVLFELIRTFVRENGLNSRARHSTVFKAWTSALSPNHKSHAVPVRLRGDVLTVEVDSSAHLQELRNFTGDRYRKKANEQLGNEAIRKVVFKLKS